MKPAQQRHNPPSKKPNNHRILSRSGKLGRFYTYIKIKKEELRIKDWTGEMCKPA